MLVLNHHIQMIKARIATCEFVLLHVIEFKYIRHGIILRSIILYLKICPVCDNWLSFFSYGCCNKGARYFTKEMCLSKIKCNVFHMKKVH